MKGVRLKTIVVLAGVLVLVDALGSLQRPFELISMPLQAQSSQQALRAQVQGRVEDANTGAPIGEAVVELRAYECGERGIPQEVYTLLTGALSPFWVTPRQVDFTDKVFSIRTSDDGRFSFTNLIPGPYCLVAFRPNSDYFPTEFQRRGSTGPGGTFLLVPSQSVTDIRLKLVRGGAVSGRVVDGNGEPVGYARVEALEPYYYEGELRFNAVITLPTDDRGEFRLYWLRPGRYILAATAGDQRRGTFRFAMYPPGRSGRREDTTYPIVVQRELEDGGMLEQTHVWTYLGGGTDLNTALPLDVQSGSTARVELSISQGTVRSLRVRGTAIDGRNGQPIEGASVRVVPDSWTPHPIISSTWTGKDGSFELTGVVPGTYDLFATAYPSLLRNQTDRSYQMTPPPNLLGAVALKVSGNSLEGVTVTLNPSRDIVGEVTLDSGPTSDAKEPPMKVRVRVVRSPDILGQPSPQVRDSDPVEVPGTFLVSGVGNGNYRVLVEPLIALPRFVSYPPPPEPLPDFFVRSISFGTVNVLDEGLNLSSGNNYPLKVTLAKGGRVGGTVHDQSGQILNNVVVAAIPFDSQRTRKDLYRVTRTDYAGRFLLRGLAQGEYKLFAWREIADGKWLDTDFMKSQEATGIPVTVGDATTVLDFPIQLSER